MSRTTPLLLIFAALPSCGAEPASPVGPPAATAVAAPSSSAPPPAPRPLRRRRAAQPETPPCVRAAELRGRVAGLLGQGKLDRARRAISRANNLCPSTARETWAAEVATLAELGAAEEARAVATAIGAASDAPPEAKAAAKRALAEVARLPPTKAGAREAARRAYAGGAAALVGTDAQAAARAADKAIAADPHDPHALALAGLAAKERRDEARAQRFFDRAREAAGRRGVREAACSSEEPCPAIVRSIEPRPDAPELEVKSARAAGQVAVNLSGSEVLLLSRDGQASAAIRAQHRTPAQMAFLHDGQQLLMATQQEDCAAEVYDTRTGLLLRQLPRLRGLDSLMYVSLSPDGKTLAGSAYGHEGERPSPWHLVLLDVGTGALRQSTPLREPPIWVGYTGDGKRIALLRGDSGSRAIDLHDAVTGRRERTVALSPGVDAEQFLAASPDGATITGILDGGWSLVDVRKGKIEGQAESQGGYGSPRGVEFSPDGKLVMLVMNNGVSLAKASTGDAVAHLAPPPPERSVSAAAFLDATHVLVLAGASFYDWEVGAPAARRRYGLPTAPHSVVAFSPDDALIATGLGEGDVALLDTTASSPVRRLSGHTAAITALGFTQDGRTLVSASRDATIRVWSVASGQELRVLGGPVGPVLSLTISADGKRIASGSADKTVRLFELASGRETQKVVLPAAALSVAFSGDGARLLVGAEDGQIRVLDPQSSTVLQTLPGNAPVRAVSWAPEGEIVSSADMSRGRSGHELFRREVASGAERPVPCRSSIAEVGVSDDGHALAVSGCDLAGTISVLDTSTWKPLAAWRPLFTSHSSFTWPGGLAFSHDGELLAQASYQGISLFRAGDDEELFTMRLTPSLSGGMVTTPDGYFDLFGRDADALRRLSRCASERWSMPLDVCEERFHVPGLFAKVMDGDEAFRDP